MPRSIRLAGAVALLLIASACGGGASRGMKLTSPDFADGKTLPERFTCLGDNVPPTLRWSSPPSDTKGFAVVVEDLDAPRATFTNWVVTGLPESTRSVGDAPLPEGASESKSSAGTLGYSGPCPVEGTEHHLRFRVHALDRSLKLDPMIGPVEAREQIESATNAVAELSALLIHP